MTPNKALLRLSAGDLINLSLKDSQEIVNATVILSNHNQVALKFQGDIVTISKDATELVFAGKTYVIVPRVGDKPALDDATKQALLALYHKNEKQPFREQFTDADGSQLVVLIRPPKKYEKKGAQETLFEGGSTPLAIPG